MMRSGGLFGLAAPSLLLAAPILAGVAGCGGKQARSDLDLSQGRELFRSREAFPAAADRESWTILIEAFRGDDRTARAQDVLAGVRGDGGLPGAFVEERDGTTLLAYGRYAGPEDPSALADLRRIQDMTFGGAKPYATARLVPPVVEGTRPEYDLRHARETHGPDALYTLQVGVYSREDGGRPTAAELTQFRKYAEDAAAQLRREGELAFYYHGPSRSMVTVGVFGTDDVDATSGVESARLREFRKRHPHNLLNGKGIKGRQTITTASGGQKRVEHLHASLLVAIPEK